MPRTPSTRPAGPTRGPGPAVPMAVALAVMLVWGGTPLFSKIAAAQIDPLVVGMLRTVIAGAIALPIVLAMRQPLPTDKRSIALLGFSGFAAFVAFPLLFTYGQHATSALHGALILATLPVFTSLFGTLIERRRVSKTWAAGCAIALCGEAAVIIWRTGGSATGASMQGDAIVLASAVVCAAGYAAGAHLTQSGYPALCTTLWGVGLSAVALLPFMGWSLAVGGWPQAGAAAWISVLILAVLTSIVGYVAWYWALAKGGISRIAGIQFMQPLFGLALAAVVLGERPAPATAAAGVAILVGAGLVQRAASR